MHTARTHSMLLLTVCSALGACHEDPTRPNDTGPGSPMALAAAVAAGEFTLTDLTPDIELTELGQAQGVNDIGDVVGTAFRSAGTRAFRWRSGTLTYLSEVGDEYSEGV